MGAIGRAVYKTMTSEQELRPTTSAPSAGTGDDEIDLRELLGALLEGRWIIATVLLAALVLGAFYALIAAPVYQADALVQVETEGNSVNAALGDVAQLLGSGEMPVTAELEIIKSRMVLGKVIDVLGLDLQVEPKFFPVIGEAIARRRTDLAEPASAPLGLSHFAWGGERISIGSIELPDSLVNRSLLLEVTEQGYSLFDSDGVKLLDGRVGESAKTEDTPYGPVSIFVRELVGRPKTHFEVTKLARSLALNAISSNLRVVERGKQSGVIALTFEGESRQLVTDVANAIVTAYQRQNVERRSAEAEQTLAFLKVQLPELRKQVELSEAQLNKFRLQQGSVNMTKETELVLQQSVELETQRVTLLQKREEALRRFTASHPVVQALDGQLRQISGEQSSIVSRVKDLPGSQQELLTLTRDVEVNNQLYTALLNSSQELQIAKAGTVGNVRIVDYALQPLQPSKPRKALILALSGVLGMFLGVVTVFLRRALRHGVEDPSVVEQRLGLPTYASIPFSDEQRRIMRAIKRGGVGGSQILAAVDPTNLAIEALRSLRTSLHFALLESTNNVVMLTGPSPGLGKSFISLNLGAVLAMSGKRVVVVDADLRRGHLHEYLASPRAPGISDYVAGDVELPGIVKRTSVENLSFISTGTIPPNPAELLLHDRFTEMVKALSGQFDHVLIDTPPVLAVTDAAVIGRLAGCTLLVLKAGEHPLRAIEDSARRLRQAGVQLRGTLFNQVGLGTGKYGYSYGYGYKYGYNYSYKSAEK